MNLYNPAWVANYFDAYGIQEWDRLLRKPTDEIRLAIHRHYLELHIRPGMRVLEIGAGAGRFTQILVELGATVHVADISPVQVDLNREKAGELGFAHGIEAWSCLDMCEMPALADQSFDVVVCYGGPLSYVFERRSDALREMRRVLRPGGRLLLSVMSLWGSIHEHLLGVLATPAEVNAQIVATGDLHPGASDFTSHRCHLFRAPELQALLEENAFGVETLSASNALASVWGTQLQDIRQDPARWSELIEMEIQACAQPGCHEMGTHLLAVTKPISVREPLPGAEPA